MRNTWTCSVYFIIALIRSDVHEMISNFVFGILKAFPTALWSVFGGRTLVCMINFSFLGSTRKLFQKVDYILASKCSRLMRFLALPEPTEVLRMVNRIRLVGFRCFEHSIISKTVFHSNDCCYRCPKISQNSHEMRLKRIGFESVHNSD